MEAMSWVGLWMMRTIVLDCDCGYRQSLNIDRYATVPVIMCSYCDKPLQEVVREKRAERREKRNG